MVKRTATSQKFKCVKLGDWLPYSERTRWKMITWPIWWGDISTGLLCWLHTNPSKIGLIVTFTLQPLFRGFIWRHRSIALLKPPYQFAPPNRFLASGHFSSCSFWDCLPFTKVSGKSSRNVKGTVLFGSFQRKISGSNGTSEKVVLMFVCFFHFFKAIFDTSFSSSRSFFGK